MWRNTRRVELWASFDDGTELYYPELICEGFITKLRSGFKKTAQEHWPVRLLPCRHQHFLTL